MLKEEKERERGGERDDDRSVKKLNVLTGKRLSTFFKKIFFFNVHFAENTLNGGGARRYIFGLIEVVERKKKENGKKGKMIHYVLKKISTRQKWES